MADKPAFLSGNKGGGKPAHPPYESRNSSQGKGTGEDKDSTIEGGKDFLKALPTSKAAQKEGKKPFGKMSEPSPAMTVGSVGSVSDAD